MARTEMFAHADELTLLIKNARKIPLTDQVMINQNAAIDLVNRMTEAYDPSLGNAQQIIENEEHIIVDAQHKADEALKQAHTQAQGMVSEANHYAQTTKQNADSYQAQTRKAAEDEANAIVADAQARANNMIEDAKAQADELVSQTTVLARAEAQAREILENATQHANGLRQQTQQELDGLLGHIDNTLSTKLNELRAMRQQVMPAEYEGQDN